MGHHVLKHKVYKLWLMPFIMCIISRSVCLINMTWIPYIWQFIQWKRCFMFVKSKWFNVTESPTKHFYSVRQHSKHNIDFNCTLPYKQIWFCSSSLLSFIGKSAFIWRAVWQFLQSHVSQSYLNLGFFKLLENRNHSPKQLCAKSVKLCILVLPVLM